MDHKDHEETKDQTVKKEKQVHKVFKVHQDVKVTVVLVVAPETQEKPVQLDYQEFPDPPVDQERSPVYLTPLQTFSVL